MEFPLDFFSIRLFSLHVVHPYSSIDMMYFILSDRSDFHMIDNLLIAIDDVASRLSRIDVIFFRWDAFS